MKDKYIFKDQDITTDVLFKIEQIVSILVEKEHTYFDDAYESFISSETYKILKRTDNLYWAESAEFIADEYYREKCS
jgi:GTP cyclohydrolase FolE2